MLQEQAAGLWLGEMWRAGKAALFWYGESNVPDLTGTVRGQEWERKMRCSELGPTSKIWFKALPATLCAVETEEETPAPINPEPV